MRLSQLFSKTSKDFPKDETSVNAKYLIKGGFIAKNSSGVFSFLPLGLRVLNKINKIIREEMDVIGGQELLLPTLVAKKYWEKSGRWDVDVMYKIQESSPNDPTSDIRHPTSEAFGLGWTHEEIIAAIAEQHIRSAKDLPLAVYQIQNKFRHEPRARNGLIRGREFLMKDLYSFHATKEDLQRYYLVVIGAYEKILNRLNLSYVKVEASGGAFTKEYTHEFQVLTPAGEDVVLHCGACDFAQNKEITKVAAGDACPKCASGVIIESRGIEVANVFRLGQRFSPWYMGSYGFGPSRAMGTLVEIFNDEKGIIWPDIVAPYVAYFIALPRATNGDTLYNNLRAKGIEVLYDDRDVSAGEKFADADLLGIPHRLVISEKTKDCIEVRRRGLDEKKLLGYEELVQLLS